MMREGAVYDELVVEAIHRIRGVSRLAILDPSVSTERTYSATRRWRVIALTNNFSKTDLAVLGHGEPLPARYASLNVNEELEWLGWKDGAVPPQLRALFDDFCDSSELGMR